MQPFLDSSAAANDGAVLHTRMQRDGYLFMRGLLPVDVVEGLRMQLLVLAGEAGWVLADTPLEDALADLDGFCVEPEPVSRPKKNVRKSPMRNVPFSTIDNVPCDRSATTDFGW